MIAISFLILLISILITGFIVYRKEDQKLSASNEKYIKFRSMYLMMEKWFECTQSKGNISEYILMNNWSKIAIYGCGDIGRLLYNELLGTDITVVCGIDKNSKIEFPVDILSPDEFSEDVDAIIVTSIAYFYDIENKLKEKTKAKIVSLEDLIYEYAY